MENKNSQKIFRLRLYSDSLGLPRGKQILNNQRYISIIKKYFYSNFGENLSVLDRARADSTISDLLQWYMEDNRYFGTDADVLILHEGIVDCAPRPIPKKIRRFVSILPKPIKFKIINFLHNNRALMQKLGIRFFHTNPKIFYDRYTKFILEASKNSKRVYVINIAPTNKKTEKHSPGLSDSILKYNKIINDIITEINANNVFLIDAYKLITISDHSIDELIFPEDGHHIRILTHNLFAEKIIENESKYSGINV